MSERTNGNLHPTTPDVSVRSHVINTGANKSERIPFIYGTLPEGPVDTAPIQNQIASFTPRPKGKLPTRRKLS